MRTEGFFPVLSALSNQSTLANHAYYPNFTSFYHRDYCQRRKKKDIIIKLVDMRSFWMFFIFQICSTVLFPRLFG